VVDFDFDMDKDIHIEGKDRNMGYHMVKNMDKGKTGREDIHIEGKKNMDKGKIGTADMHIEEKK
jgi:hypothetical protein